jgi:AcrR family transcriptional regulator
MGAVSVDPVPAHLESAPAPGEGLRERKKRMMRQLISDTATAMFLERGFDEVRVAEVAAACDVSEKTVYNYFPTKESLVLDREEPLAADIRRTLGPGGATMSPIQAAVGLIAAELGRQYDAWGEDADQPDDLTMIQRFAEMLENTPALRAAQRDMMDRLVDVAAQSMAARAGVDPDDPEPQIAADALLGLWRVQYRAMRKYSDGSRSAAEVRDRVLDEVRRAARLIDTGLWSFGMVVQGNNGREQLKVAAEAANEARKQVVTAIKQARGAWRQVMAEAHGHEEGRAHGPRSPRQPRRPGRPGGDFGPGPRRTRRIPGDDTAPGQPRADRPPPPHRHGGH